MNKFFWSDLHLGHAKSIEFDNRPFRDLEHMHNILIRNYLSCVRDGDVCYFLGDIGYKQAVAEVIPKMNKGNKILIRGNHDKSMSDNFLYSIGFNDVLYRADLVIAKERVTLTHCPFRKVFREDTTGMGNNVPGERWHGEFRHDIYSAADEGQFLLHGHIHATKENYKDIKSGRQWDVGVPGNKYRPVSASEVESWIVRSKRG